MSAQASLAQIVRLAAMAVRSSHPNTHATLLAVETEIDALERENEGLRKALSRLADDNADDYVCGDGSESPEPEVCALCAARAALATSHAAEGGGA